VDEYALAGNRYAYHVRAYDLAGNRSDRSDTVEIFVAPGFAVPADAELALDGAVEAEKGYAA
jgi:hypothetical protein